MNLEVCADKISKSKWQKIGISQRSGILLPLFAVYSRNSIGIGDFADLKLAIDWAAKTGNSILQLLPMNETGPLFCPYDSVSSFALEPAYLSFPKIKEKNILQKKENIKKLFPTGPAYLDYRIKEAKLSLSWELFINDTSYKNRGFQNFLAENDYWLVDFALYKVIKAVQQGLPWYEWEDKYQNRDIAALEEFKKTYPREIDFQIWLQWHLFKQFKDAKVYARKKKVLIKGDLPILVSRDSADVWSHREFFKLEYAAGAPADMYCVKGQRWGMPTYNWGQIASGGYRYVKEKLKVAENFYDILRIDHVVGLFRIWSIPFAEPLENQGLNGFFDPQNEGCWGECGRNILSVINANTRMLLCAEDLGVIPKVCTDTLGELGIPGNDVQRWVKDWSVRHDFLLPQDYRKFSVAMLSTHDTTNWPAWWENEAGTLDEALFRRKCRERGIDYERVKDELFDSALSCHGRLRWKNAVDSADKLIWILGKSREEVGGFIELYLNSFQEKEKLWKILGLPGAMRQMCDPEIMQAALELTLDSAAIFCINTIIDWLYLDDIFHHNPYQYRINTPGTISQYNWSQALPLSLEELSQHKITGKIAKLIKASARN